MAVALSEISAAAETEGSSSNPAAEFKRQARLCRDLLSQTGMPASDRLRMQSLISYTVQKQRARAKPAPADLFPFLVQWVGQARRLNGSRQAAALLVADFVMDGNVDFGLPRSTDEAALIAKTATVRAELFRAGARFEYSPLDGSFAFDHDWLQEAFRTAPESGPGEAAFLFLMERGFDPSCCCRGGALKFRKVIRVAGLYLRDHPQASIRPQVLLALGDAYRDIVALADGVGPFWRP